MSTDIFLNTKLYTTFTNNKIVDVIAEITAWINNRINGVAAKSYATVFPLWINISAGLNTLVSTGTLLVKEVSLDA